MVEEEYILNFQPDKDHFKHLLYQDPSDVYRNHIHFILKQIHSRGEVKEHRFLALVVNSLVSQDFFDENHLCYYVNILGHIYSNNFSQIRVELYGREKYNRIKKDIMLHISKFKSTVELEPETRPMSSLKRRLMAESDNLYYFKRK